MNLSIKVLQIIFLSIGSLFMITFCIIGIWSFVLFKKYYTAKRIQNYVLEKLYQSITQLVQNSSSTESSNNDLLNKTK